MKFVLAVCFALFGSALSLPSQVRDNEDLAVEFIHCVHKALDTGLEVAGIPPHEPLALTHLDGNHSFLGSEFDLYNNYLAGLLVYNLTEVKGQLSEDGQSIFYNYSIYWPSLVFTGNFSYSALLLHDQGNYTLELKHVVFSGYWNMTLPNQEREFNLDGFEVKIHTEDVEFHSEPVPPVLGLLGTPVDKLVKTLINHIPVRGFSDALQKRFNDRWIHYENGKDIIAIMDNCKA